MIVTRGTSSASVPSRPARPHGSPDRTWHASGTRPCVMTFPPPPTNCVPTHQRWASTTRHLDASTTRRLDTSTPRRPDASTTRRLDDPTPRHLDASTTRRLNVSTPRHLDKPIHATHVFGIRAPYPPITPLRRATRHTPHASRGHAVARTSPVPFRLTRPGPGPPGPPAHVDDRRTNYETPLPAVSIAHTVIAALTDRTLGAPRRPNRLTGSPAHRTKGKKKATGQRAGSPASRISSAHLASPSPSPSLSPSPSAKISLPTFILPRRHTPARLIEDRWAPSSRRRVARGLCETKPCASRRRLWLWPSQRNAATSSAGRRESRGARRSEASPASG